MVRKKKIIMELSKYDITVIRTKILYFEQFNYPFYIDEEYCVYVKYDRKYHWIGYARPLNEKWFFSQFE